MDSKAPIILAKSGMTMIDSLIDAAQRLTESMDHGYTASIRDQVNSIWTQAVSLKHLQSGLLELLESEHRSPPHQPVAPSTAKPSVSAKAEPLAKGNYTRMEVSKDVFAYVENRTWSTQKVKRYFCESCFDSNRLSEMKFDHSEFYIDTYECVQCGSTICINNESQPQDQAAHYGWDWDDYWG